MKKTYLLAPGPTPVPPEALTAMSMPIIHHRSPDFIPILESAKNDLKWLFQTENMVLILASTGTGGMVGAVNNFLSPGDKAVVVRGGKFGERWTEICEAYGVLPINIDVEWGYAVKPEQVEAELKKDPSIKAVLIQASETSTGVAHPTKEIGEIVKKYPNCLFVVDAITAMGVFDMPVDKWGIDVCITGSQKALMLPPGLAFVSVSEKAWKMNESAKCSRYYFNFKKEKKEPGKEPDEFHYRFLSRRGAERGALDDEGRGPGEHIQKAREAGQRDPGRGDGDGPEALRQGVPDPGLDGRGSA